MDLGGITNYVGAFYHNIESHYQFKDVYNFDTYIYSPDCSCKFPFAVDFIFSSISYNLLQIYYIPSFPFSVRLQAGIESRNIALV